MSRKVVPFLLGIGLGCTVLSAQAGITVDQKPLTVQNPLEPNILFILDDSGSMTRDFMPDSISGVNASNGVGSSERKILRNSGENLIYYNPSSTYSPPPKAEKDGSGNTQYYPEQTQFPYADDDPFDNDTAQDTNIADYEGKNHNSSTLGSNGNRFDFGEKYTSGFTTYYYFIYTTKSGGSYTEHRVANSVAACASSHLSATEQSNCTADTDVQNNVANWFAYYRSRILLAKSAAMNAFSDLNEDYRFGYGALNRTRIYKTSSTTMVEEFGDGSAGTRKADFYTWLENEYGYDGTPLLDALNRAGTYYEEDHPWLSDDDGDGTADDAHGCRQAFTIMTSDGYWSDSISVATADRDESAGSRILGPNGQDYTYSPAAPYSLSAGNTLADVAMKYWKKDLKPGISNEVPTSDEDPAFWQHMVTFTIGLGLTPTGITPSSTSIDDIFDWARGGTAISGFSWPTSYGSQSVNNVADMAHAAVNGHGGFYSAKNPSEFESALSDALARASARVGSAASLAANSTKLDTGTFTYQANYYTEKWTGDLKAYAVDSSTGVIANSASWSAEAQLPAHGSRNLWTYNPSGSNYNQKYVEFDDPSDLSTDQQNALGANATERQNIIDYLRGDLNQEQSNGGNYRNRQSVLGDIVNSQPVYVGKPNANFYSGKTFSGASDYSSFASSGTAYTRNAVIYVAGNDGFLHGFRASDGVELFGYMPAMVIAQDFGDIVDPDYGDVAAIPAVPHKYYNDGELTVADVYFSSGGGNWKTVLVGTTGRGEAKAVYALDVTDPTDVKFLWERSAYDGATNSDYIGQVVGKPIIAQVADGSWKVIMGNGYNSTQDKAALLIFDIDDGDLAVQIAGTSTSNALSAPALMDTNADGIQDVAYAGDFNGKVWEFPSLTSGTLTIADASALFAATDGSNPQSITAGLLIGTDPDTGNRWLFFGTGQYLESADISDTSTQTWYGIIVDSTNTSLVTNLASSGRSALKPRSIMVEQAATSTTLAARGFSQETAGDMNGKSGWYIDLTSPLYGSEGERMVTPNQFQGSVLLGTSRIPQAVDLCNPTGTGWVMALDPFTGTNLTSPFFDYDNSNVVDGSDVITDGSGNTYYVGAIGFDALPNNPIFVGNRMLMSFDDGSTSSIETSGGVGSATRESWRELY